MKSGKGWIALEYTENVNGESDTENTSEWEMSYNYYYVASNTSTLMTAGLSLKPEGKVLLSRAGAEIMAYNAGTPVEGSYIIESYRSETQVSSFKVEQRTIVNGDMPEIKQVLPDVIIKIHVPLSELKKADDHASEDEDTILYGYYSALGQHILTDGNSNYPNVFFHMGE